MTKLAKSGLEKLIGERITAYKNPDDAVSRYNAELETIKEYNGRQILELIQNADDAGAKVVSIRVDTTKNEIVFFNDGDAFSFEGIKSIMISNLSNKVTSSYIGNKGLGFRSILNWAQSVTIYSAGLRIEFSQMVIEQYLKNELQQLNSDLDEIRKNRNLSSTCIPIPILGLPRVSEVSYEGCTEEKGCALIIMYDKSKQDDIKNQINAIDEKTLLFLPNIDSINVEIDTHKCSISDNNVAWDIHSKEEKLPEQYQDKNKNEKKKYIVTIAIPESGLMEDTNFLYNYLPSKEKVHLPFLLHATVELNSSRNHVNESDVNVYILQKAAELIQQVAKDKLDNTNGTSNWNAYRMMTPTLSGEGNSSLKPLYDKLDELKKTMAIYPTVDNKYVTESKYCYYNNDISNFWRSFEVKGDFSKILQPVADGFSITERKLINIRDAISNVSQQIKGNFDKLVSLIRHLFDNKINFFDNQSFIPILIDNEGDIIEGEVYIQDNGDSELTKNIPSWITFRVVSPLLSEKLIKEFKDEIGKFKDKKKQDDQQNISDVRCLVGLLDFIDMHYFDKTGIANQVISKANAKLDSGIAIDKSKLIGEMLDFLYNLESGADLKNVRLLNETGEEKKAVELMLPTKLNKQIFEGVEIQYVLNLEEWRKKGFLESIEEEDFEKYMKKLGVNRLLDIKKFEKVEYDYLPYLKAHKVYEDALGPSHGESALKNGSRNEVNVDIVCDTIMQKLESVSLSNVFLFISSYNEVFENLKKTIRLRFQYYKNWWDSPTPYNYIRYQLSSLPCVKKKVFGSDLILNDIIDIDVLKQTIPNVVEIIDLIRTDFGFESEDVISEILNNSPKLFPNGKNIRKLYKLVVDGLAGRNMSLRNIILYASDVDGKKEYHQSTEVFYSDNTSLPKKVIKESNLFRLDYPSRQGVDKISTIFGLQRLNDLSFEIKEKKDSYFTKEFEAYFDKLKPYILLYVVQNASKEGSKKNYADGIKKCIIHLVSQCSYSRKDETPKELDDAEFINVGNDYYLKVNRNANIEEIRSSIAYCNAITEILGMVFKLETKNEHFIHVFQSFDFMKKFIDETRKDEIDECYKLLGISTEEKLFWEKYAELKNLSLDFETNSFYSQLSFDEKIIKNINFSEWNNKDSIDFIKLVLNTLESDDQKKELLGIVDLSAWHKNRFDGVKTEYTRAFVHKLWTILNEENKGKRNLFFSIQDEYSNLSFENNWEHELKEDGDYLKCLNDKITALFNNIVIRAEGDLSKESAKEEHINLYPGLIQSVQEEKDMENQRWMLYFNGYKNQIEEKISLLKKEKEQDDKNATSISIEDVNGKFVDINVKFRETHTSTGKRWNKSSSTHTSMSDRRKVNLGKDAEARVDIFLRSQEKEDICKYGEWVSKRDDSAGYDFTYIVDGQERLLEVKHSSDNTFIISSNEYKVAMKNINVYDIAIVNGDTITIYKSFFSGNPFLEAKDYYVSFSVERNNK